MSPFDLDGDRGLQQSFADGFDDFGGQRTRRHRALRPSGSVSVSVDSDWSIDHVRQADESPNSDERRFVAAEPRLASRVRQMAFFLHAERRATRASSNRVTLSFLQQPPPQGSHSMSRFRSAIATTSRPRPAPSSASSLGARGRLRRRDARRAARRRLQRPDVEAPPSPRRDAPAMRTTRSHGAHDVADDRRVRGFEDDELESDEDDDEALEERVLEAFRNDPILAERAIDIGVIGDGVIELAGWVEDDDEARARGDDRARRARRGHRGESHRDRRRGAPVRGSRAPRSRRRRVADRSALGRTAGRNGPSAPGYVGRAGSPRRPEGRARGSLAARPTKRMRNAAEDTDGIAERRTRAKRRVRGDRTGGSPIAPTGVPKADHVAEPARARTPSARLTGPTAMTDEPRAAARSF